MRPDQTQSSHLSGAAARAEPLAATATVARASAAGVATGAAVLLLGVLAALLLRRKRKPRPLSRRLLAASVKRADDG